MNCLSFDYCLSNPPYQKRYTSESGKSAPRDIFHRFQDKAMNLAEKTVMIYPSKRWLQQSGKDTANWGKELLKNPGLVSVDHYDNANEVFSNIGIQDGVSIVTWDSRHNNNGELKLNNETVKLTNDDTPIILDRDYRNVAKKVLRSGGEAVKSLSLSRGIFGIESNLNKVNPDSLKKLNEVENTEEYYKVFTIGESNTPGWYYISKDEVVRGVDRIEDWKVIVSSSHPVRDFEKSKALLKPGEIYGRARVGLAHFKTESEAKNYLAYTNTVFYKRLFKLSPHGLNQMGVFTPDLEDYSNNNPLFSNDSDLPLDSEYRGLSLEERLYKKFKLTAKDIELLKKDK